MAACVKKYNNGEFVADRSLMPEARTDAPLDPSVVVASYDDYCDKVVISWTPTVRTSSYDVYRNGELLAQDITDTTYVDTEALTTESTYTVFSKNVHGRSDGSVSAIGRMAAIPSAPENFSATDGEYESKVILTWDAANFAKYYILKRDNTVLSDSVVGTSFSDNADAPTEPTEYSIIAVGVCGESDPVTTTGYCDPLLAFRFPLVEDFEGFPLGILTSADDFGDFMPRFQFENAPNVNGVVEIKGDNSKYIDLKVINDKASIQLIFPDVELLVGESYTISFDVKAPQTISLHIGIDKTGDGYMGKYADEYFLPTAENTKNHNAYGVNIGGTGEWKTVSYAFPQTGVETKDPDPDPEALGWTLGTIQEGQEHPIIQLQMWSKNGTYAIDNIKIERIK